MLTQQIAAEVAAREWPEDELFELVRGAYPYRDLEREEFDECVDHAGAKGSARAAAATAR